MTKKLPPQTRLFELLRYDAADKRFYWKASLFGGKKESLAGQWKGQNCYINIDGVPYRQDDLLQIYRGIKK